MAKFIDHTGKVYKNVKVISYAGKRSTPSDVRHIWNCICICGSACVLRSDRITTSSCGCLQKKAAAKNNSKRKKPNAASAKNTLFLNYKKGAEERKLSFSLSKSYFLTLTRQDCHYCSISPNQVQKAMGGNYIYNGVDRIDSDKGYTINNCVSCCKICNRAKLDMSYEEFKAYLNRIKLTAYIKSFYLLRTEDLHGNSGIGIVAVGSQLPSGKCILEWLSSEVTETIFENAAQIERLHGHEGRTKLIWGDPPCEDDKPKKTRKKKKDET